MRKVQKGFSLIELLIVVAIILIIAAIAIPNLLRSRIAANEASAVSSLRTINTALISYATTYPTSPGPPAVCPNSGFPPSLANLGPAKPATSLAADQLDGVLGVAAPVKSGYNFTYNSAIPDANGCNTTYTTTAFPQNVGTTGQRAFCSNQSGVIHFNTTGAAPPAAGPCDNAVGPVLQ